MDARLVSAALVAAALLCCGANHYRTPNFIVHSASSDELGRELAAAAEKYRYDLALEWLGAELPNWQEPCPIDASRVTPRHQASGKTSFMFHQGIPFGWEMEVIGTRQQVLESVLPHEVTHTIFATHFGRPLPRWADEGACTTVEDASERSKQDTNLIHYLTHDRGIAFNRMFQMTEYPRDIHPLYSQGYSLARYLISHGGAEGKRKFVSYIGDGMRWNNWTRATQQHYGYESLSHLQIAWVEWVKSGSPALKLPANEPAATEKSEEEPFGLASAAEPEKPADPTYSQRSNNPFQPVPRSATPEASLAETYQQPPVPGTLRPDPALSTAAVVPAGYEQSSSARPVTSGWYAKQRRAKAAQPAAETIDTQAPAASSDPRREELLPVQATPDNRRKLLEWTRPAGGTTKWR